MLVAMCFKKCSASLWRSPSTDVTKGVNVPRLSSTAFLYSFFFSRAPVSKIDSGVRCRCDGASVSMTFISNTTNNHSIRRVKICLLNWKIIYSKSKRHDQDALSRLTIVCQPFLSLEAFVCNTLLKIAYL